MSARLLTGGGLPMVLTDDAALKRAHALLRECAKHLKATESLFEVQPDKARAGHLADESRELRQAIGWELAAAHSTQKEGK